MHRFRLRYAKSYVVAIILLSTSLVHGQEQSATKRLIEFKSEAGKFSVHLPGKPEEEVTEVGTSKQKQYQFNIGTDQGAYIVSYQDNPNLQGSTPKELAAALESGRDRLIEVFRGKLLESKSTTLDKTHPGLNFRISIPQAKGEARCRFYMAGTRLYQVMAIGLPAFASSKEATEVLDSFKLTK